jgi:hypothetical protein
MLIKPIFRRAIHLVVSYFFESVVNGTKVERVCSFTAVGYTAFETMSVAFKTKSSVLVDLADSPVKKCPT